MKEILVVALITVVVLTILIRKWVKFQAFKIASEEAKELFPVWAIQGPFNSGEESAKALLYAHMAMSGTELPEDTLEAVRNHSVAYDDDPEAWEENRNDTLAFVTEKTMDRLKAVHAFAAIDQIAMGISVNEECFDLEWSSNPGAYEAHLIRRCGNPYFPKSQQTVSKEELVEAKSIDNDDFILAEERFIQIAKETEAPTCTVNDLQRVREELDELFFFSRGVGGRAYEIAIKAAKVREGVILDIRAAFPNDEETQAKIDTADGLHMNKTRKFSIPVLAQMFRERSPINEEDTLATILSEDPETIRDLLSAFPKDTQLFIQKAALDMMNEAKVFGYIDPHYEEKKAVLES